MRAFKSALLVLAGSLGLPMLSAAADEHSSPGVQLPAELMREAARLRDEALTGTGGWELTRSLVYAAGPRLAGSEGDKRAVAWALATLEEHGFSAVRAERVRVPHWVRGDEHGEIIAPVHQSVVLTALGGSVGTPDQGIEAEVVMVDSLEALAALRADTVQGRIVFMNQPRIERSRDGAGYRDTVALRSQGPSAAAKLGASAFLIRSVGTSEARVAHTGATNYSVDAPRIPAAALSNADADMLGWLVAQDEPVRFRLKLGAELLPDAESANVIGEIPGTDLADEIVLVACHLDSWDITPGANDDAVGCALMIEAARRAGQASPPPRRTIRIVFYADEEFGLSGARAYAGRYADTLARHIVAMEADFGAGRAWRFDTWVDPEARPLAKAVWQVLEPLGIEFGENNAFGGADLIPLRPHRVPFFGLAHDGTWYFDIHHTIDDTMDKVDPAEVDFNVAAYTALTYLAATIDQNFGRSPVSVRPGQD